ncbi:MAG: hypothetical protein AAB336_11345 [Acidobacteriota bacterium]
MAKVRKNGFCRLCDSFTELSFEHVPPKSAFNDKRVLLHSLSYINDNSYQIAKKTPARNHNRGLGEHSLCERCNNLTGAWYGTAYSEWAKQGMIYLDVIEKSSSIDIPFYIQPLNVLKQMATMTLAMSNGGFVNKHIELKRFVLNKRDRFLPKEYLFYVYLTNKKSEARYMAETVSLNIFTGESDFVLAEVALPPFGFVVLSAMPEKKSSVKSENLCSINHFANYDYNGWITVFLKIPIHRIWSPTPLDYRKID